MSGRTPTPFAESKRAKEKRRDQPIVSASSTTSNAETASSTPKYSEELKVASQLRKFTFIDLKLATRNFRPESLLGEGGFGCLFKGWIEKSGTAPVKPGTGLTVAVKTLNIEGLQGHKEWLAEVDFLGYWYTILSQEEAWRITSSEDYNAKLSDFGLAKDGPEGDKTHVSTRVMGTYGYAAPEYVMTGHLSSKSDVYSFGVVLLEMLTGRRSMNKNRPNGEHSLVEWARPHLGDKRRFFRILDPRLEGHFSIKGAQKASQLAAQCLSRDPKTRPRMSEVVEILKPLPNLKDMASSSYYFQTMQSDRRSNVNAKTDTRAQAGFVVRKGQPMRSLSASNNHQATHPSPKPRAKEA
ncbi:putative receptor-like protein kinase [Hibiscus syriacus]|uniref:Receptor-like protein kinase n=1 Tax=Hibiscus syriacus TaxID=106335 RepID=A0A6A3C8I2_HIBSY|nr:putative receptor-like protein kinase [Hibiscus syriacus]